MDLTHLWNSIAGSDTTAISLSSVLYYLSKYPDTRRKLEKDIQAAIAEGRASNPITYAEAIKLPYLYAALRYMHDF
jgi:cytochrome P450